MVLAGFHGKYVNWLKPFFIERASHEKTLCLKNGTPHSRYFSDELGVPNFLSRYRTSVCQVWGHMV